MEQNQQLTEFIELFQQLPKEEQQRVYWMMQGITFMQKIEEDSEDEQNQSMEL